MEDLYMVYGIEQQSTKTTKKKTWFGHLTRELVLSLTTYII